MGQTTCPACKLDRGSCACEKHAAKIRTLRAALASMTEERDAALKRLRAEEDDAIRRCDLFEILEAALAWSRAERGTALKSLRRTEAALAASDLALSSAQERVAELEQQ